MYISSLFILFLFLYSISVYNYSLIDLLLLLFLPSVYPFPHPPPHPTLSSLLLPSSPQTIDELQVRVTAISLKIEEATNQSAEVEESLHDILEVLNVKTGGENDGTATSEVIKMRAGIKNLKYEINSINIQTGVLSSIIMTRNQVAAQESHRAHKKKQDRRLNRGKQSQLRDKENDDDELDQFN